MLCKGINLNPIDHIVPYITKSLHVLIVGACKIRNFVYAKTCCVISPLSIGGF